VTPRREMAGSLILVALGAVITLAAAGRPRVTVTGVGAHTTGAATPGATALALVALAGGGAVLLARPWVRVGIGVVLTAIGLGIVALFFRPVDELGYFAYTPGAAVLHPSAWAWVGAGGGAFIAIGAGAVAARAARWPVPRKSYDPPATVRPGGRDPWEALDRGEDPTA
jgi:hypothetical protein